MNTTQIVALIILCIAASFFVALIVTNILGSRKYTETKKYTYPGQGSMQPYEDRETSVPGPDDNKDDRVVD